MSENQIIRATCKRLAPQFGIPDYYTPNYYDDKRKGGKRKAFKMFNRCEELQRFWTKVLRSIRAQGVEGWKLYKDTGQAYLPTTGIVKRIYENKVSVG